MQLENHHVAMIVVFFGVLIIRILVEVLTRLEKKEASKEPESWLYDGIKSRPKRKKDISVREAQTKRFNPN